jgi:hypothetical protein
MSAPATEVAMATPSSAQGLLLALRASGAEEAELRSAIGCLARDPSVDRADLLDAVLSLAGRRFDEPLGSLVADSVAMLQALRLAPLCFKGARKAEGVLGVLNRHGLSPWSLVVQADRQAQQGLGRAAGARIAVLLGLPSEAWLAAKAPRDAEIKLDAQTPAALVRSLLEAPGGLWLACGLTLEGLPEVTALPGRLRILGPLGLQVRACPALTGVPEDLYAASLRLHDCESLDTLPAGMRVRGTIQVGCCPLRAVPAVRCEDLYLYHLPLLERLDSNLEVSQRLGLSDCDALRTLPPGLRAGRDLSVTRCGSLVDLGDGLTLQEGLSVEDCPVLTRLGDNLAVGGKVEVRLCDGLVELGHRVSARGITLSGCGAFRSVGEGLEISGALIFQEAERGGTWDPASRTFLGAVRAGSAWDGILPEDAKVGSVYFGPSSGWTADEWRAYVRTGDGPAWWREANAPAPA